MEISLVRLLLGILILSVCHLLILKLFKFSSKVFNNQSLKEMKRILNTLGLAALV